MNIRDLKNKFIDKWKTPNSKLLQAFIDWLQRLSADYTNIQALGLWTAAISTGLVAVLYAQSFRIIETFYETLLKESPILASSLAPLLFFAAWWLVHRFAPSASGSGIPQVMAAIDTEYNGKKTKFVDQLLSIRTAIVKILSSILCLAGGGAIGREGPTLQVSSAIFHFVGQKVRKFYPQTNEQTWLIAGASAGLASAFNTPLGGIVYAIEELGMHHFHKVRTALLTAVIISGLVAQMVIGSYLYLGFPKLKALTSAEWPMIILTAFFAGLLGALFSKALIWASRRRKAIRSHLKLAGITLGCGLATGILVYLIPTSHGSGADLISKILFENEASSFLVLLGRMLSTSLAYLSGAAGGIFAPSLSIGACIGSKIAYLFGSDHSNLLAMMGMIGFLTGVTHTPFTSFILVMEMSDRHSAIFPMMITALIANSVAKSIQTKSFYESVRDDYIKASATK